MSDNHSFQRYVQHDARKWAAFAGVNYTTALHQVGSPLAQGIQGDRVTVAQVIEAIEDHPLTSGTRGLGEDGVGSGAPFDVVSNEFYLQVVLCVELLRTFAPVEQQEWRSWLGNLEASSPGVSSKKLKHTAEGFFQQLKSDCSDGRLILAAVILGLPMVQVLDNNPEVQIGVSEREHAYFRRATRIRSQHQTLPGGHYYRPAGFASLTRAVELSSESDKAIERWDGIDDTPSDEKVATPFHVWLTKQTHREDPVGQMAFAYSCGIRDADHRIVRDPQDLAALAAESMWDSFADDAIDSAAREWATSR